MGLFNRKPMEERQDDAMRMAENGSLAAAA